MDKLSVKLYSHAEYKQDEPTNLNFEVTNHSKSEVHILKWNTPLEGLKSDCLDVKKGAKQISYDGMMIKRGQPKPDDFVLLQSGQSINSKVDIGEAYNISSPGKVKVNYRPEKLTFFKEQPTQQLLEKAMSAEAPPKPLQIETKQASFIVSSGETTRLTSGIQARQSPAQKKALFKKKDNIGNANLLSCLFNGGTTDQQNILLTAHQNGYRLVVDVLQRIDNNADYELWFGTYTGKHYKKVNDDYKKIRDDFENKQFTYDLTGAGCGSGVYAYTYKGGSTIWLCDAFWSAADKGTDSRAGTLVHEHSHASAYTDDIAYGQPGCQ